ncbi:nuclear transport factor 2 family protein [Chitinophaga eiseniae]|uniref:ABM domain-containing protein n=1 Tax=Chitinophaga eiseniae TaxID=634771 RepID=A0A847S891_9BACT|nr:nuclear transport factor 2 family protein [Chitinophaga eiseniae]NLR78011.1 hypothetical protein [Chitinophaga eiseniae]
MKALLITAFLPFWWWGSQAQNYNTMETTQKDAIQVSQVLENDYFTGIYTGDTGKLRKIYHPGTLLFGDVKDQPYAKTLDEYLTGVAGRQSPKDSGKTFKGEVLNIRVTNSIAVAEVRVKMYDFLYQEYLSFHKLNGNWLIVNKMISDVAKNVADPENDRSTTNESADKKLRLIATMEVLPGFETDVKKAISVMAVETRKEAGVELFLINTQSDSPQTIVVYEVYQSSEIFELHKAAPHAKAFFEFVKGKIKNDKIATTFLTDISN